jgi:ABC-type nitrate/sulfonate/bicarbonate transport system substrate-binding protein
MGHMGSIGRMARVSFTLGLLLSLSSVVAAQEKVKFPISASSKTLGYSPLWVASRLGFFDRQGLDAQLVLVAGADKSTMALVGGSVNVSSGGTDTVIAAVEQGADLVSIGGVINGLTHYIMGGKKFRTFEDLRGANVGSSGLTSGTAFVLRRVLRAKGMEYPRDYNLINVGGSAQAFLSLTAGRIDAAIIAVPLNYEAANMGYPVIAKVVDFIPNYQLTEVTVKRSWAEKNRLLTVRFMKGLVQAMRWMHDNKEPAIEFLAKEMQLKPEAARRGWEYYTENKIWNANAETNVEGVRTVIQIAAERGQFKGGALPPPTKYLDHSYVEEALKELGKR